MKNASIKFSPDEGNPHKKSIQIKGELTIDNIKKFKELMMPQIEACEEFTFEIDEVAAIDLAFYQFLVAIKNTLANKNKKMLVNISLSDEMEDLFIKSGLDISFN